MQDIIGIRDQLRDEIEELDGGYSTVAKLLNVTTGNVHKTLCKTNVPRLASLEAIRKATDEAKKIQTIRISQLVR